MNTVIADVFSGSNSPEVEVRLNSWMREFRDAATSLGKGIVDVEQSAKKCLAVVYLVNRTALNSPGLSQRYTNMVLKAKGNTSGQKQFNFALSILDVATQQAINGMFGNVKASIMQALDVLSAWTPDVDPSIEVVLNHIDDAGGIKKLAMQALSDLNRERRQQAEEAERVRALVAQADSESRENAAKAEGYESFADKVVKEQKKAEIEKKNKATALIVDDGAEIALPAKNEAFNEGQFYLFKDGCLVALSNEHNDRLLRCAASLI